MQTPKVSVLIPTYNHAHYLPFALNSVFQQSYPNVEVIVIDDGSTDGTAVGLKPYQDRIIYNYKENGGTSSALNWGIALASGEYICWLSADDVFREDKVAKQVALLESDLSLGFCYTSFTVIDARGVKQYDIHSDYYTDKQLLVRKLVEGCFINGSSVMMRSAALKTIGNFDEGLPQAHDYDMWFRLLRHYSCGFLGEPLLAYRWHGKNMSSLPDEECSRIVRARARQLFPEWLS